MDIINVMERQTVNQDDLGVKELGYAIAISIDGEIPRIELEDRQRMAGLTVLGRRKQKRSAVYQALQDLSNSNTLLTFVGQDENWAAWRLIDQVVDTANEEVDFTKRNRIRLNKHTDELSFEVPESIEALVKEKFAHYLGVYSNQDLYQIAVRYIDGFAGVRIARGLFFVTEKFAEDTANLKKFVDGLPGGKMLRLPVVNDETMRETMYNAFVEQINKDMEEVEAMIAEIANSDVNRRVRKKNFLDNFEEFKQRTHIYSTMMRVDAQNISKQIESMEKYFLQVVG